ncbi:MAG TPA: DMT family transporter [Thermoleophilia bacterium]|nr:DMT family transporter [Thermoleophilia bacterium]
MLASLLALVASLSWGTADFWAGLESRRTTVWTAALIGQGVAAVALVLMLLVLAPDTPSAAALVPAVLGGVAGGVGALLQYRALTVLDMSVASPIVAGAALVPVLWGLARGEQPGALQIAGVAMTLAGIVAISRGPSRDAEGERVGPPGRADRAGVLLAIGSAVTLGLFLVAVDYGDEAGTLWTVTVVRAVAFVVLALMAAVSGPVLRPRGRALPILVAVGLLIATANISFASATSMGYLSIVAVLGWLNPAVTIVWARAVLHERLRPLQVAAAVLVFAGIVCITLG